MYTAKKLLHRVNIMHVSNYSINLEPWNVKSLIIVPESNDNNNNYYYGPKIPI